MTLQHESPTGGVERRGIECPKCDCRHFLVIYTRRAASGKLIRRRECHHCGRQMTIME